MNKDCNERKCHKVSFVVGLFGLLVTFSSPAAAKSVWCISNDDNGNRMFASQMFNVPESMAKQQIEEYATTVFKRQGQYINRPGELAQCQTEVEMDRTRTIAMWRNEYNATVMDASIASIGKPTTIVSASSSRFGFGYCTMENERVYMKDMPVFVSAIFPRKANTQLYHNNVDNQWLSYVMSLPGFRGGTRGGCGSAPTEVAAKRALESDVGVPLRSHAWAYRKETFWTPGQ